MSEEPNTGEAGKGETGRIHAQGHLSEFGKLARAYTEARQSGNAEDVEQAHQKALEYARYNGLLDSAIANRTEGRSGLERALKYLSKGDAGEGGAFEVGSNQVLKPISGRDHKESAETRYGFFQSLLNAPHMKPAVHYSPIHDTDNSVFLLEYIQGPEILDILRFFSDAEQGLGDYIKLYDSRGGNDPQQLPTIANELRKKYLRNGHNGEGILTTEEMDKAKKMTGRIPIARANLVKSAIREYSYWVTFWKDKTNRDTNEIELPNKAVFKLDSPEVVRENYAANMAAILDSFTAVGMNAICDLEKQAWELSTRTTLGLADWRKEFIVPYRDAYPRNYRLRMETDTPSLQQLLDLCSNDETLMQSLRHYDFGARSSHILEDFSHIIVTPEAKVTPKDGKKLDRFMREMYDSLVEYEAPKKRLSNEFERLVNADTKDSESLTPLVIAFYRSARKMGLALSYGKETLNLFERNKIGYAECDESLNQINKMFGDYNSTARQYLDWIAYRIKTIAISESKDVKEEFRKYQDTYKRVQDGELAPKDISKLMTEISADDTVPLSVKQTGCALYAQAFLRQLANTYKPFLR